MRSRVASLILILLGSASLAFGQDSKHTKQDKPESESTSTKPSPTVRADSASETPPSEASSSGRYRRGRARNQHSPPTKPSGQASVVPFTLVSGPSEYLSGEANVTVKGNENPIVRLGLARSGVTLVEFPSSDRFFALHPGNSDMVTIDESPTKQNDHFFVFRAGSNFVPPPGRAANEPSASIMAQMRSGMVVTFLIYPVRELTQMAHRVVILYDRADVVAARRAAGLAVNLEESQRQQQEHSIRIAGQLDSTTLTEVAGGNSLNLRPRIAADGQPAETPEDHNLVLKRVSAADHTDPLSKSIPDADPAHGLEAEARKALKLAITSPKPKNWTRPLHGLSVATFTPKDFKEKDGAAMIIVAVSNVLPEPLRIVPGQPDLSLETRDEQGKKTLLVERIKPIHIESSAFGDSIPAGSTLYYAIAYRRPVLGVHQHLRVTIGQINAADEPAVADLATSAR